jgi:hypothetical protein
VPITEADVEIPATYSEAVARLRQYRDQIRDAVAAGTYSKGRSVISIATKFRLNAVKNFVRSVVSKDGARTVVE